MSGEAPAAAPGGDAEPAGAARDTAEAIEVSDPPAAEPQPESLAGGAGAARADRPLTSDVSAVTRRVRDVT